MAEQVPAPASAQASPKKKLPVKMLSMVAVAFIVEAVVIIAVFKFAHGPETAHAEAAMPDEQALNDQVVELLVVADRFQNTRTGRTYLYDTEIFVTVKRKHEEKIKGQLEAMSASIRQDIRTIVGRAEPQQLLEPTLATLERQINAMLADRIGKDEEGKSLIDKVLITKFTQFRTDL